MKLFILMKRTEKILLASTIILLIYLLSTYLYVRENTYRPITGENIFVGYYNFEWCISSVSSCNDTNTDWCLDNKTRPCKYDNHGDLDCHHYTLQHKTLYQKYDNFYYTANDSICSYDFTN